MTGATVDALPAAAPLPRIQLLRQRTDERGTFGVIVCDTLWLVSGELPWHGNEYARSCIPPGTYHCVPLDTENRDRHYQLLDAPQRSEVLIHTGHWCGDEARGLRADVRGCILPGLAVAELAGQDAVTESRAALDRLLAAAPSGLLLEIVDATPGGRAGLGWRP